MILVDEAQRAVAIADALSRFRDALAEQHADDLSFTIGELNKLDYSLRQIDKLLVSSDGHTIGFIKDDLNLVHESITYTLEDVWEILGRTGNGNHNPSASAYRQTWKEISLHCRTHGRQNLGHRIETYRLFVAELCTILKRRPPSQRVIEDIRGDLRVLLENQDRRLITMTDVTAGLTLDIGAMPRPKSYERERLGASPTSPTESRDSWHSGFIPPPVVQAPLPTFADEPGSPTATFSTTSRDSSGEGEYLHWAKEVFKDLSTISATPLPERRGAGVSQCFGEHQQYAKDHLDHKFEELFKITFYQGLCVRFYHRERDHRARILCETPERSGHFWYSTLPLNALQIRRNGSSLYLCQPRGRERQPQMWALLQFSTVERLVLFFCTFMSLRSHDGGHIYTNIRDSSLKDEDELFTGEIRDDGYIHALRICRDNPSKSIRLLSSVWLGDMKHTPVWTAFITHHIYSPTWMSRPSSSSSSFSRSTGGRTIITLCELKKHVFSPRYEPGLTERGEHVLEFTNEEDARAFIETIEELALPPLLFSKTAKGALKGGAGMGKVIG